MAESFIKRGNGLRIVWGGGVLGVQTAVQASQPEPHQLKDYICLTGLELPRYPLSDSFFMNTAAMKPRSFFNK